MLDPAGGRCGPAVLDGTTLELRNQIELPGFSRPTPSPTVATRWCPPRAGSDAGQGAGALTDVEYPAAKSGHVVNHEGGTVLFADGSGEVTTVEPAAIAQGPANAALLHIAAGALRRGRRAGER